MVDGLNIINDDGDLRRRDGLRSIMSAAPHFFPAGYTSAVHENASGTKSEVGNRRFQLDDTTRKIYIGSASQFDGFDWPELGHYGGALSASSHLKAKIYYSTADDTWTELPWFHDTTTYWPPTSSALPDEHAEILTKAGRITWHRAPIAAGWATHTIEGLIGRFWVKLEFYDPESLTASGFDMDPQLSAPGVRAFRLSPVNMIAPLRIGEQELVLIGSDRVGPDGDADATVVYGGTQGEGGAMLGVSDGCSANATEVLHATAESGAGEWGKLNGPLHRKKVGIGGSYSDVASTDTSVGTTGQLNRSRPSERLGVTSRAWLFDASNPEICQWRGGWCSRSLRRTSRTAAAWRTRCPAWPSR